MITSTRITFTRNRAVMRNGIRIGWIEGTERTHDKWRLRFTPASGIPGVQGFYRTLATAKIAAKEILDP
jgi:hypothetical protein